VAAGYTFEEVTEADQYELESPVEAVKEQAKTLPVEKTPAIQASPEVVEEVKEPPPLVEEEEEFDDFVDIDDKDVQEAKSLSKPKSKSGWNPLSKSAYVG